MRCYTYLYRYNEIHRSRLTSLQYNFLKHRNAESSNEDTKWADGEGDCGPMTSYLQPCKLANNLGIFNKLANEMAGLEGPKKG